MHVWIGADHAGLHLKKDIIMQLKARDYDVYDAGAYSDESVDYPDYAEVVAMAVAEGRADRGILICGSGIGMSIAANKVPGIRAALCHSMETVELSRRHNDANILVLGERIITRENALLMVDKWLLTDFENGRHQQRLDKITLIERRVR